MFIKTVIIMRKTKFRNMHWIAIISMRKNWLMTKLMNRYSNNFQMLGLRLGLKRRASSSKCMKILNYLALIHYVERVFNYLKFSKSILIVSKASLGESIIKKCLNTSTTVLMRKPSRNTNNKWWKIHNSFSRWMKIQSSPKSSKRWNFVIQS